MEAQWLSDIIKKNFDKVKNKKSAQPFQDLMRPFLPCSDCLVESPQNSSCSKPSVPSNIANDPSNKSNNCFQSFDDSKKVAEGFLKEAAGLHEAMSHLRPNVHISNENDKNGGGVIVF